jgi:1,4-alpha-glucan branching enzyme
MLVGIAPVQTTPGRVRVTFRLTAPLPGHTSIVGDFNGWQPGRTRFVHRGRGIYSAIVEVPEGQRLTLRYLSEGGRWHNPDNVADRDGANSVVVAVPQPRTSNRP